MLYYIDNSLSSKIYEWCKATFVAFTFDDEEILEIKLVKILNPENAELIKLSQWKNIDSKEYKKG